METSLPPMPPNGSNDKLWIILCHLSPFLGVPFILPLIVYLVMKQGSPAVAAHAAEAFNFHLSMLIYAICSIPLVLIVIGIPLLMVIGLLSIVCAIIAALRAAEGGFYRYPLTIRLVG
jgi:uncharacterized protein